jgi:16S rRNA (cytosine1402-N4)-methyltransferase
VPPFAHKPVMLGEVLEALRPSDGGRYIDGTLGGAGHAEAILAASSPTGWLYGCDRDGVAIETSALRLRPFAGRFEIRRGAFLELPGWVEARSCDGALLDLGVSSPQLDSAGRGFSFQQDGPLDMRMDDRQTLTAAGLVNEASETDLARIFWEFGDERESRRFARAIARDRVAAKFETTRQLAGLIERLSPRRGRTHPATKVFQALRIAVNDEVRLLGAGLDAVFGLLKPGGRLAVITFHSIEDRIAKAFGRDKAREYAVEGPVDVPELRRARMPEARLITRKAVKPGPDEERENPRSRSAQLRVLEKL